MTTQILVGDCRAILPKLPAESVHCCVTSPPYFGLRDYGVDGQIGLEQSPDAYVAELVAVFREVRRVLRKDGTVFLNIGDSYAANGVSGLSTKGTSSTLVGSANAAHVTSKKVVPHGLKPKDLIGIPWRVAFALQADGWWLRSDIIWHKPNPMPESVTDRPTSAHEHVFLLAKSARYYFDADAVAEPAIRAGDLPGGGSGYIWHGAGGKNKDGLVASGKRPVAETRNIRNVWTIAPKPFKGAHFATFPPALIEPCIKAGCPVGGTVLDPFFGAGTTGLVAGHLGRDCIGIELNPAYGEMARDRIAA